MSTAVLILGMHRSGTSALTRVLNLLGVDVGDRLLAAAPENPGGFWEHADVVDLHERLLAGAGRAWDDPRPIPDEWLTGEAGTPFREELRGILRRDFGDKALWGIKDPRLCRLLPLWIPLLDELGVESRFVIAHRDPREVAASLARRNGLPDGMAQLLWLQHALPAERQTRGRLRAFLTYDDLLRDWRGTVDRISHGLEIAWPVAEDAVASEVAGFLDPTLRHHDSPSGEVSDWMAMTLAAFASPEPDEERLDAVNEWLRDAEALFLPWADHVATATEDLRALVRDRSGRLARLRERVREMEQASPETRPEATPATSQAVEAAPAPASERTAVPAPEAVAALPPQPVAPPADRSASALDATALLQQEGTQILRNFDEPEGEPRVSIVIPLYDKAALTAKCLESIARHTPDGTYEVILVDNASQDETAGLLACLEGNVKILRNEKNLGFATACNQGAALATTEAVLFLNNDTEATPGWLEPLLALLDDPAVGIGGAKLLFPDGRVQHAGVALLSREGAVPLGAFHLHYGAPADAPETAVAMEVPVVTGACLLVRRRLLAELGGFDPFFWNGCEDIDLCLKAGEKGYKIVVEPASVLVHHESMSGAERFSRTGSNEQLLASRWAGRAPADYAQDERGQLTETGHGRVRPYVRGAGEAIETGAAGDRPVASIVVLTCNQLPHTQRCLESVEQFTPEPHEIIVVDNGSTDGTIEWLGSWAAGKAHVQILRHRDNRGFAAGCNAGMAAAHGRDLVLLNNDTVVTEGWLGGMLAALDDHADTGIIGPMTNCASGPQVLSDIPYGDLGGMHEYAARRAREYAGETTTANRLPAFCWLVRRDVVDDIGGFDERFGKGNLEDDDFCLRAAQAGWGARIVRSVFVHHVGSRTFAGEGIDIPQITEDNFELFKRKWGLDPDAAPGYYPFAELVTGPRHPKAELPRFRDRYEPEGTSGNVWRAKGEEIDGAETPPTPGTQRLRVGVIGAPPRAAVEALFRRHGHAGEIPVFRTGADLEAALRMGGEVLAVSPDVVMPDDALKEMVTVMRAYPAIGALAPMSNGSPGEQHVKPAYGDLERGLNRFAQRQRRRHGGQVTEAATLDPVCVLLRPEAVDAAGGPRADATVQEALAELWPILKAASRPPAIARGAYVHRAGGGVPGTKGGAGGTAGEAARAETGGTR